MKNGFDFYETIYSKDDFKKYVPLMTKIYTNEYLYADNKEQILTEFKKMLHFVATKYLMRYLPKKHAENFEIQFDYTNYKHTNLLGQTDLENGNVKLSSDALNDCLLNKNTATPVGIVIHECSHLIQLMAQDTFSLSASSKNAYCLDLQKWLEDDWYKNTYNNLIKNVVVPYLNKINPDKKIQLGTKNFLPSQILYTHDLVEIEANTMQSHLQRHIGSIFADLITNESAKNSLLKNYFSTKNNYSGYVQSFYNKVKTKNYNFIEAVANLSSQDFANMLPLIEEYSKQFNCKTPTAIKSSRFANFLNTDCIENFILIYYGNTNHKTFDDFVLELKKTDNKRILKLAEHVSSAANSNSLE